jgi:hypothetical protein
VARRGVDEASRLRSDRVSHVPLKLLLHQLVAVVLNNLVRLHGQGFGPIRHGIARHLFLANPLSTPAARFSQAIL